MTSKYGNEVKLIHARTGEPYLGKFYKSSKPVTEGNYIRVDSELEAIIYRILLKKYPWQRITRAERFELFSLQVDNKVHVARIIPDFVVRDAVNEIQLIVEGKGKMTTDAHLRIKLFLANNISLLDKYKIVTWAKKETNQRWVIPAMDIKEFESWLLQ